MVLNNPFKICFKCRIGFCPLEKKTCHWSDSIYILMSVFFLILLCLDDLFISFSFLRGQKALCSDFPSLCELATICVMCNDSSVDFNEVCIHLLSIYIIYLYYVSVYITPLDSDNSRWFNLTLTAIFCFLFICVIIFIRNRTFL